MNFRQLTIVIAALAAGLAFGPASAADAPPQPQQPTAQSATVQKGLKQDATCTRCHDETETKPILSIYQTKHGNRADPNAPTCQSCHGDSDKHLHGDANQKGRARPDHVFGTKAGAYKPDVASVQSEQCMTCHNTGLRMHWNGSQHESRDIPCASCHTIHAPRDRVLVKAQQEEVCFTCHKEQRAQTHRISTHPLDAGKMACSDCHNPHGSTGPKLLVKNSVNETCYTCHAEKRGPFLWEHGPVVDDCTNCHTPHGSNSTPLLKARMPWLCQECHSGDHAKTVYSGANLAGGNAITINGNQQLAAAGPTVQVSGRSCVSCHSVIHGSNHPAGAKFQR